MSCVLFGVPCCFGNFCSLFIDSKILPGLLERIIGIIQRRLLLLLCWLFYFIDCCFLSFNFWVLRLLLCLWRSRCLAILNLSFIEFVSRYEVYEISFCEITSRSSGFYLTREHAIVKKVEPSGGRYFYVLHLMVDLVRKRSRWRSGCEVSSMTCN